MRLPQSTWSEGVVLGSGGLVWEAWVAWGVGLGGWVRVGGLGSWAAGRSASQAVKKLAKLRGQVKGVS